MIGASFEVCYLEVKMKKCLLKLMVRFSLPISLLSLFGALSGCVKTKTASDSGGTTAGVPPPPEGGDVAPLVIGEPVAPNEEKPVVENPAEPTNTDKDIPMVFPGIMMPPSDPKGNPPTK